MTYRDFSAGSPPPPKEPEPETQSVVDREVEADKVEEPVSTDQDADDE